MDWLNSNAGAVAGIATGVIALMAIITAILTYQLAKENRLLRKAETTPEVLAYLKLGEPPGSPYDLVVGNFGKEPALKVGLKIQDYGVEVEAHQIEILPQGIQIAEGFGVNYDQLVGRTAWQYEVTLKYQDLTGKCYLLTYPLRVSSLEKMQLV